MGEKVDPVLFVSKRRELRLIVKPSDRTFDEARRPVIIRGERVEFVNNRFTTSDKDLIDWLKQHPLYNREFTSNEGLVPLKQKPRLEKQPDQVSMIVGSRTVEDIPDRETPEQEEEVHVLGPEKQDTPISKEEVEHMISTKLDSFLEKVSKMVQGVVTEEKEPIPKPKRVFTCPVEGCGMVFKTGIEVGRHKKQVHPDWKG